MDSYPPSQPPPPPVIRTGPPSLPPRRGGGWKVIAIVAVVILGLLAFAMIPAFFGMVPETGRLGLKEVILEQNRSVNKIAVIDVAGIISGQSFDHSGSTMVDYIHEQLKLAGRDKNVKSVLLKVNSPGGEVLASDDIYRAVTQFQNKSGKPVVAYLGSVAASGGYYVSAPCTWIVSNELSITGSIGVIMHAYNYRGLMNKVGLKPQTFKSGKYKDMLSGDRDLEHLTPAEEAELMEERKMVQDLIDETYDTFKTAVKTGRDRPSRLQVREARGLVENWADYADGRVFSGRQAYQWGFVDQLGNFQTAVSAARDLADISDANLIQYQQPFSLGNLFQIFGKSEGATIKVDLGMDFPKLQPGSLYFLTPTVLR
jgi:protease IV